MSAAIRALERHASEIIEQHGLTPEAKQRLVAVLGTHAMLMQVALAWPRGTLVNIPTTEIVAAVGVPGLPERDAVDMARMYLSAHVLEHVGKGTWARVDALPDGVSLVLSPGGYCPDGTRDTLASPDYRTYNLPPVAAPPAKRARKVKHAETSPEPATPADGE